MTAYTRTVLTDLIQGRMPDNTQGLISADDVRQSLIDVVDSAFVTQTDTGADVYQITATQIPSTVVPSRTTSFWTTGYTTPGDSGAALYIKASGSTTGGLQSADGQWWKLSPDQQINCAMFGVDMTGATFSDTAFKNFMNFLQYSFVYAPIYGQGIARIPRGKVKLSTLPAYVFPFAGLIIAGDGIHTTTIEWHNDTDTVFDVGIYLNFTLMNMSINHVPQNPDRATWTCALFKHTGIGGGLNANFLFLSTNNFAYIDYNSGSTNNDTNLYHKCRIANCRTFMYGRSAQSVLITVTESSVYGKVEKLFDIAGYPNLKIENTSIIIDGVWLYLGVGAGYYGDYSTIVFDNCKGETLNESAYVNGFRTRLIECEGGTPPAIYADVEFRNCGLTKVGTADPAYYQINVPTTVRVRCIGGAIFSEAKIATVPSNEGAYAGPSAHAGIIFENMRSAPLPSSTNPTRLSGVVNSVHPAVTWQSCRGITNLTVAGADCTSAEHAVQRTESAYSVVGFVALSSGPLNYSFPFYNQRQRIHFVQLCLAAKTGNALTLGVYSDAAKANLIGTITLSSADNSANYKVYSLPAAVDIYVTEGLYMTLTSDANLRGRIMIQYSPM